MKRFLFLVLLVCSLGTGMAQSYVSLKDTLWCCRYFQRLNGDYFNVGDRTGRSGVTPPISDKVITCYYAQIPKGHCRADMYVSVKYGKTANVNIKVIDPNTEDTLWTNTVSAVYKIGATAFSKVEAFPDIDFPRDCFYRIELTMPNGNNTINSISHFEFEHESPLRVYSPKIFMAPSTHLYTWGSTDPDAPPEAGGAYDWMYGEVLFPSQYHRINSYVMTLGLLAGYSGISTVGTTKRHGMLFSQWDNGDTEVDMYLPSYLRSSGLDCGEDWEVKGFGGEGTGVQTVTIGDSPWRNDEWVQFVANCRPEDVEFWVEDRYGNDSVKLVSHNTLVSLWWKQPSDNEWKYISTLRAAGRNMYFSGWYSFVENYTDNGGDLYRRAYFRHGFLRSISNGRWYNRNFCGFGHTDGSGQRGSRSDYGHGRTDLYDNCFYLSTGGFRSVPDDSSRYVTLIDDHTCVDTINLQALLNRVDRAILKGQAVQTTTAIEAARAHLSQDAWHVIGFSDQEEVGEGDNGRAAFVVDGIEGTYWHSRYRSGSMIKVHYIDFKADKAINLCNLNLIQKRATNYRVKKLNVYTSADGKEWTLHQGNISVPDEEAPSVDFTPLTTQYVRLEFSEGYGSNLFINELYLRGDYQLDKVKTLVDSYVSNPDELRSYPANDLKELTALYDGGQCTDTSAMIEALKKLSAQSHMLQFSTVVDMANTGVRRAYILRSRNGQGTLCVDTLATTPRLVLRNATDSSAISSAQQRMAAANLCGNWSFVRSDHYGSLYLYNIGSGLYLDLNNEQTYLSRVPTPVTYSALSDYIFTLGLSASNMLRADATSNEPLSLGSRTKNSQFTVIDNQYFTPSLEWADSLIRVTEVYDKFAEYKKILPQLMALPDGYVGSFTSPEQKAELLELYANGSVGIDKARELVDMLESMDRIPFEPESKLYRIVAANPNDAATDPAYLTIDSEGVITSKANNKADQMWYLKPQASGNGLLSQGLAISHLTDKAGTAVKHTNGEEPANFQLTTDGMLHYTIANVKYSPYFMANNQSPVKVGTDPTVGQWMLEPYDQLNVSLNSGGILSAYYDFDVILPEGLEAYTICGIDGDKVQLVPVDSLLPARTPAVLRGDAFGAYTMRAIAHQSAPQESTLLRGTFMRKTGLTPKSVYTISVKSGKPCLSLYAGTSVNANQCYVPKELIDQLQLPTTTFVLDFENATGLSPLHPYESEQAKAEGSATTSAYDAAAPAYDLHGHKVRTSANGIIIEKGKIVKR